jgi:hypothetical protein
MKRLVLLTVLFGLLMTVNAAAAPWPCDCVGGYNPYTTPTFWYLLDYNGYPLENGDCVCAYWVGADGLIDGVDVYNAPNPRTDDELLNCGIIEYGGFFFSVTTWGVGENHPEVGEEIYLIIYDDECDSLTTDNYFGVSNTYAVQNYLGEVAYFLFPGDPGYGYTDQPLPVELISFTATARDGEVLLEWKTASETNALGFLIERDETVVNGELIPAAGNSSTENTYSYADKGLENGTTYAYNLISVDIDGVEQVVNENPVLATPMPSVPAEFALHQNYPNPFNPVTEIRYDLAEEAPVTLKIYNVLGAEVATLVDMSQQAGAYMVRWNAKDMATGIYFCSLDAGDFKAVKKMVYLK